ncbi:MAG: hypothetical protein LQ342_001505 [Letrouitia transgressa]|nr:MAG: hypothetical protein LQ342_001505 [Letrouitia transgressa]
MTIEKLQFSLPAVFTIGPDDKPEPLKKYAKLLTGQGQGQGPRKGATPTGRNHVQDIVKGIIEGETRVIVSGMTMEEIFKERQVFKTKVIDNVQSELNQFGLRIYNANVKELQDTAGSEYFKFLSRKAHEGASNQAKVDVANARMVGEIGEAEKRGRTKQEISKIDAETAVLETKRKSEKAQADAELATTQTRLNMGIDLAKIEATRRAESKDAELQRDVETKRAEMELERIRAIDLVQAKIKRESAQQVADAKFYSDTKSADGELYKQHRAADAAYYRTTKEAEASFYTTKKEAEALMETAKAYGQMSEVFGGPQGLLQYMMLRNDTYKELALANAKAINGLQPKITVWNTGEGSSTESSNPIRNLMQSLPPMLSTIHEQTGIAPPGWLAQMSTQSQSQNQNQTSNSGKGKINSY